VRGLVTEVMNGSGPVGRIVDDVSLRVEAGEIVGIIGESGSGKTLTVRSILGLLPTGTRVAGGSALFQGSDLIQLDEDARRTVRGRSIGFVFQQPSSHLNPLMRIGDQISERLREHSGLTRAAAERRAIEILEQVRVPDPAYVASRYPHQLSGGLAQRVMIGIAIACDPQLVIGDEPTAALDVTIQAQIVDLLRALREELGIGILLITHDFALVSELCDRVYVLYAGKVVEETTVVAAIESPEHPYTEALLKSVASIDRASELEPIRGYAANPADPPSGCRFHPRCPYAKGICAKVAPPTRRRGSGGASACWIGDPRYE
jgi:oligopeptide/dipeptide ABC transporter ATP-binding protein